MGPVFDKYVLNLGNGKNSMVGVTESVSGLVSLFVAFPIGFLVDSRPEERAKLCRICGYVGYAATVVSIIAVLLDNLWVLYVALVLLGIFFELSMSAAEAIFADSIPAGDRSGIYTTKGIITTACSGVGPLLTAVTFLFMGDEWDRKEIHVVLIAGSLLLPVASLILRFFKDPPAARSERPELTQSPHMSPAQVLVAAVQAAPKPIGSQIVSPSPRLRGVREPGLAASPAVKGARDVEVRDVSLDASTRVNDAETQKTFLCLGKKQVPYILAGSDFLTAIGAGMTVKFFNLFFIQDYGFSASNINWLQTVYPLVIALFMPILQKIAQPMGRAQASCLFFGLNVLCLVLLSQVQSLPILLGLFLVRGGFANAVSPINRSILMDFTSTEQRGMWNAIDSLTGMSWSGSAFIGGLLADSHDYRYTFLITGMVYLTATVIYSPTLCLVPRAEKAMGEQGRELTTHIDP